MEKKELQALRAPLRAKDLKVSLRRETMSGGYAALTVYKNDLVDTERLDEIFQGNWSSDITSTADGQVVVRVEAGGVARAGVSPYGQQIAFKNACTMLGIGHELLTLPDDMVISTVGTKINVSRGNAYLDDTLIVNNYETINGTVVLLTVKNLHSGDIIYTYDRREQYVSDKPEKAEEQKEPKSKSEKAETKAESSKEPVKEPEKEEEAPKAPEKKAPKELAVQVDILPFPDDGLASEGDELESLRDFHPVLDGRKITKTMREMSPLAIARLAENTKIDESTKDAIARLRALDPEVEKAFGN